MGSSLRSLLRSLRRVGGKLLGPKRTPVKCNKTKENTRQSCQNQRKHFLSDCCASSKHIFYLFVGDRAEMQGAPGKIEDGRHRPSKPHFSLTKSQDKLR